MTPRIQKAIDIFLDAINKNTLSRGDCNACAVGNLCAAALNIEISEQDLSSDALQPQGRWSNLFYTDSFGIQFNNINWREGFTPLRNVLIEAERLISKTEFSIEELMKIEYAFETNAKIDYDNYPLYSKEIIRKDQIRGLEAVIKVMLEFDECKDTVKEVFTEKAELIPIGV